MRGAALAVWRFRYRMVTTSGCAFRTLRRSTGNEIHSLGIGYTETDRTVRIDIHFSEVAEPVNPS